MDHEHVVNDHSAKLAALNERSVQLDALLRETVARAQQSVNEYHALSAKMDVLAAKHDNLHRDFTTLRSQLYWVLTTFASAFVLGGATWILKGGLMR